MKIPEKVRHVSAHVAKPDPNLRFAIHGIHIQRPDATTCQATVTDGSALVRVTWSDHELDDHPLQTDAVEGFKTIVPAHTWNEAAKTIPKRGRTVMVLEEVSDKAHFATFDGENKRELSGPALEGRFPDADKILPQYTVGTDAIQIAVDPKRLRELLQTVERISTNDEQKSVILTVPIDPKGSTIALTVTANANGLDTLGLLQPVDQKLSIDGTPIGEIAQAVEALKRIVDYAEHEPDRKDFGKIANDALLAMGVES